MRCRPLVLTRGRSVFTILTAAELESTVSDDLARKKFTESRSLLNDDVTRSGRRRVQRKPHLDHPKVGGPLPRVLAW
jgi:hypothetical protein